ncbi:MAG: threonine ammonia-lyase, biosynthetic [Alteromonadaceae bacterium]|nr:MAG: threonine ammonia-lyase, biosynthetic [Alteromonadaceae bacterium]
MHMGIDATIVMPRTTPSIKVDAVRRRGAKVVLEGDAYDDASKLAKAMVERDGMTYIPPFDDVDVIAGQGTVAMEILRQYPKHIDVVFIPVGGGGLCAGMAAYIKSVRPQIKIVAVEAEDSACLKAAIMNKSRVVLPHVGIFAEGVAVAQIGEETFRIIEQTVDEFITATTDEMCAAIKDIFEDTRSIAEPAGALALAGLKKYVETNGCEGQTLIAIDSGANTNFDRLRYISERTEIGEQREAILAVTIPEKAGSYLRFCELLGEHSITEFNYRYADNRDAHIFVGLQIPAGGKGRKEIVQLLTDNGYEAMDMTDNEMAKLHIRYMVGGRAPEAANERVYRFEFPERPGALLNFLTKLANRWNISMFHYRNHGSAFGRVLVGMQVPDEQGAELERALEELKFNFWEETDNPAYSFFLS